MINISDLLKATPQVWVFHVFPEHWELVNPYGDVYHSQKGELMEPAKQKIEDLGMEFVIEDFREIDIGE